MEANHSIHMATMVFTITRHNHIGPMLLASLLNSLGFTSSLVDPCLGTATFADTRGQMSYRLILVSQRGVQPTQMLDADVTTTKSGPSTTNLTTTMNIARDADAGLARSVTMNLSGTIVPAHVDRIKCPSRPIRHPYATHLRLMFNIFDTLQPDCLTKQESFYFLSSGQFALIPNNFYFFVHRRHKDAHTHIAVRRRRRHPLYLTSLLSLHNFPRIIVNLKDEGSCQGARCLLRVV